MDPAAAFLDAFGRRLRRRRRAVAIDGARRGGRRALAASLGVLALLALGVLPPPGGAVLTAGLFLAALAAGAAWGAARALRAGGSEGRFAADLDAAIRGDDLVPAAAALAARRVPPGRFGAALLERAAADVGALPLDPVGPLPRPPWALLAVALLVAFLVGLLPKGGLGLLPGLGAGWGAGGAPAVEGVHVGAPAPKKGGAPKEDPKAPPAPPETSLEILPLARSYPAGAPVSLGARVENGKEKCRLFVAVDGAPFVPEGTAGKDAWASDLRAVPGLAGALPPGKHTVTGELRDGEDRVVARAPDGEITVEADGGGGGGAGTKPEPKPEPTPQPQPKPQPKRQPKPKRQPGTKEEPKGEPPPPPPSAFVEKLVRPLFGEGAEVEKKGRILVLDPEGSRGETPREVGPEEAVAEIRAKAEDAARREGMDPRDAEAVRLYFEALRRRLEEKR